VSLELRRDQPAVEAAFVYGWMPSEPRDPYLASSAAVETGVLTLNGSLPEAGGLAGRLFPQVGQELAHERTLIDRIRQAPDRLELLQRLLECLPGRITVALT
jgi:hypothetical protein